MYEPSQNSGFSWAQDGGVWTTPLKGTLSGSPTCTVHAMWANRRGPGAAGLYVAGLCADGEVRLIACQKSGSDESPTCTSAAPSVLGQDGAVFAALDGVPAGQGERVFAVVSSVKQAPTGDSNDHYSVNLWTIVQGGQGGTNWTPIQAFSLQNDKFDPAQAVVALSPERALLLEGHGTVIEVSKVQAQNNWGAENLTSTHSALATWPDSETDPSAAPVTYVRGLVTPTALLLVGHVQAAGGGLDRVVILRWIPRGPVEGPLSGQDPPPQGPPDWNTILTTSLGVVGVPLACEGPFGGPSDCPRVGIYDAALAPAPQGGATLPLPLMLVGAVHDGNTACARAVRFVRTPPEL